MSAEFFFWELSPSFLPVLTLNSTFFLSGHKICYISFPSTFCLRKNVEDSCFNVEMDPVSRKHVLRAFGRLFLTLTELIWNKT